MIFMLLFLCMSGCVCRYQESIVDIVFVILCVVSIVKCVTGIVKCVKYVLLW